MKTVPRHDTGSDQQRAAFRALYYVFSLPVLLFFGVTMAAISYGTATGKTDGADGAFNFCMVLVWAAILIPFILRRRKKQRQLRQLKDMVKMLSRSDRFSPQPQHQVFDAGRGKYLGVDTKLGTLLYIHMVKKGVIDVIGLSMQDWTDRELEGSELRLFTRMADVPVLRIYAHPLVAKDLFYTLGAMSNNSYADPFEDCWSVYVGRQSRFIEFEHDVVVPQTV